MKTPKYNVDHNGTKYENDFNPSFIVTATSQPTPISRWLTWIVMLLITITIIWASIAKVDIVAKGQGKIIPDGQVKSLQSILTGKIEDIYIKENDFVNKGDILFKLQNDDYIINKKQHQNALYDNKIKEWKNNYLLNFINNKQPKLNKPEFLTIDDFQNQKNHIQKDKDFYLSKTKSIDHAIKTTKQEILAINNNILKLRKLVAIKKLKLDKMEKLKTNNMISELDVLEAKEALILTESELESEQINLMKLKDSIISYNHELFSIKTEFKSKWMDELIETTQQIKQIENEIKKLEVNIENSYIRSPINGYIQELTKYTIGGVIQSGEEILVIVPENVNLVAEALIPSREIGFVEKGMDTQIKLDAFNFTKYGLLKAELIHISNDAIEDEKLGLVYKTIYKLENEYLEKDNIKRHLQTGMGLSVEVKTGERTVMEFFLSPIVKHFKESARER